MAELRQLAGMGDKSFRDAIQAIIHELETKPFDKPLKPKIPIRPTTASLSEPLHGKLLIGTAELVHPGVLAAETARTRRERLTEPADKEALAQLYRQTVQRGLHDNGLRIATRRGSAKMSELKIIPVAEL